MITIWDAINGKSTLFDTAKISIDDQDTGKTVKVLQVDNIDAVLYEKLCNGSNIIFKSDSYINLGALGHSGEFNISVQEFREKLVENGCKIRGKPAHEYMLERARDDFNKYQQLEKTINGMKQLRDSKTNMTDTIPEIQADLDKLHSFAEIAEVAPEKCAKWLTKELKKTPSKEKLEVYLKTYTEFFYILSRKLSKQEEEKTLQDLADALTGFGQYAHSLEPKKENIFEKALSSEQLKAVTLTNLTNSSNALSKDESQEFSATEISSILNAKKEREVFFQSLNNLQDRKDFGEILQQVAATIKKVTKDSVLGEEEKKFHIAALGKGKVNGYDAVDVFDSVVGNLALKDSEKGKYWAMGQLEKTGVKNIIAELINDEKISNIQTHQNYQSSDIKEAVDCYYKEVSIGEIPFIEANKQILITKLQGLSEDEFFNQLTRISQTLPNILQNELIKPKIYAGNVYLSDAERSFFKSEAAKSLTEEIGTRLSKIQDREKFFEELTDLSANHPDLVDESSVTGKIKESGHDIGPNEGNFHLQQIAADAQQSHFGVNEEAFNTLNEVIQNASLEQAKDLLKVIVNNKLGNNVKPQIFYYLTTNKEDFSQFQSLLGEYMKDPEVCKEFIAQVTAEGDDVSVAKIKEMTNELGVTDDVLKQIAGQDNDEQLMSQIFGLEDIDTKAICTAYDIADKFSKNGDKQKTYLKYAVDHASADDMQTMFKDMIEKDIKLEVDGAKSIDDMVKTMNGKGGKANFLDTLHTQLIRNVANENQYNQQMFDVLVGNDGLNDNQKVNLYKNLLKDGKDLSSFGGEEEVIKKFQEFLFNNKKEELAYILNNNFPAAALNDKFFEKLESNNKDFTTLITNQTNQQTKQDFLLAATDYVFGHKKEGLMGNLEALQTAVYPAENREKDFEKDVRTMIEWANTGKLANVVKEAATSTDAKSGEKTPTAVQPQQELDPQILLKNVSVKDLKKLHDLETNKAEAKQDRAIGKAGAVWKFILKLFGIFKKEAEQDIGKVKTFVEKVGKTQAESEQPYTEKVGGTKSGAFAEKIAEKIKTGQQTIG